MEIALIQVFFFTIVLNKNRIRKKRKNGKKNRIPWHVHTIQKSTLVKTMESHFSLLWVMELYSCLGKIKVFLIILAC